MNIPLSSPHVHSQFCDGASTAEEMVLSAIARGFVSLGISSHAVQDFDQPYALLPQMEAAYIAEVLRLKAKYRDRIRLWLGTERDAFSTADRAKYEYVIGSAHYLRQSGQVFAVDGDAARLQAMVRSLYQGDGEKMALHYYRCLGEYIASYRPDIIGHFDVVVKHSRRGQLFDPESPAVKAAADEALAMAFSGCRVLEVNTGALARGSEGGVYPSPRLLRLWRQLGGDVILSSDCHSAEHIAFGYEEGLRLIRDAGYHSVLYLGKGAALFERSAV